MPTTTTTSPQDGRFAAFEALSSNVTIQKRMSSTMNWLLPAVKVVTTRVSQPQHIQPQPQRHQSELYDLDIQHALFPHGPLDPMDPSSFNDLLTMAESIIQRYKNAYREQADKISELEAEHSVLDEECDEMQTRSEHLKVQLDGMAARVASQKDHIEMLERHADRTVDNEILDNLYDEVDQQTNTIQKLNDELSQERKLRWKAEDALLVQRYTSEASRPPSTSSDSGFESEGEPKKLPSARAKLISIPPKTYQSQSSSSSKPHTGTTETWDGMIRQVQDYEAAVDDALMYINSLS